MWEDKLNKLRGFLSWRKLIKECQERAKIWRQQETEAIAEGLSPRNKIVVRYREIRQGYEEIAALLSNPTATADFGGDVLIRKVEKCRKRERALIEDAKKEWEANNR